MKYGQFRLFVQSSVDGAFVKQLISLTWWVTDGGHAVTRSCQLRWCFEAVFWSGKWLNSRPEHKAVLDDLLLGDPRLRPGKMFGYPGYYAGEKLCICLYEGGVGLKLPEHRR